MKNMRFWLPPSSAMASGTAVNARLGLWKSPPFSAIEDSIEAPSFKLSKLKESLPYHLCITQGVLALGFETKSNLVSHNFSAEPEKTRGKEMKSASSRERKWREIISCETVNDEREKANVFYLYLYFISKIKSNTKAFSFTKYKSQKGKKLSSFQLLLLTLSHITSL